MGGMQGTLDLFWLTLVLAGTLLLARTPRPGTHQSWTWVGVLACTAVLLFPVISVDDDLLRARDVDPGGVLAWIAETREERGLAMVHPAVVPAIAALVPIFRPPTRHAAPTAAPPVLRSHLRAGPLGQRPPPPLA